MNYLSFIIFIVNNLLYHDFLVLFAVFITSYLARSKGRDNKVTGYKMCKKISKRCAPCF